MNFETPTGPADAERIQRELRRRVVLPSVDAPLPPTVTGVDISYAIGSDQAIAAAVTVNVEDLRVRDVSLAAGTIHFPYVPGLLAFRELPLLLQAIAGLPDRPDTLMCDGYGIAHPRRFGLACHLGVLLDVPSFGVAKTDFVATHTSPPGDRGAWSPMLDGTEILGRAVRTRTNVKPVYVSVGHRITLSDATALTVALSPRYRIPEPTRQADILSREALRTRP